MILFNMDEYSTNNPGTNLISSLPKRRMGVAGRITYDYAHRYMTEVNAGYNGSENFAKGHRWGFFPSISLGWNVAFLGISEKYCIPFKSSGIVWFGRQRPDWFRPLYLFGTG